MEYLDWVRTRRTGNQKWMEKEPCSTCMTHMLAWDSAPSQSRRSNHGVQRKKKQVAGALDESIQRVRSLIRCGRKGMCVRPGRNCLFLWHLGVIGTGKSCSMRNEESKEVVNKGWAKLLFRVHQWNTVDCDAVSDALHLGPTAQPWLLPNAGDHKSSGRCNTNGVHKTMDRKGSQCFQMAFPMSPQADKTVAGSRCRQV